MTYPSFYKDFNCIADRCRHSCCVGWDVDIDPDTYEGYLFLSGEMGDKIRKNIYCDEEGAHFKMQNGRCPFLNERGLCDIITAFGEDALCDICALHPRFYNNYGEREEAGLGLCCEEAARLTLLNDTPFTLENDGDDDFCRFRKGLFDILWDEGNIDEKTERLLFTCKADFPKRPLSEWAAVFRSLERLDSSWDLLLDSLSEKPAFRVTQDRPFLQLFSYLLYRHLDPENLSLSAAFCYLSYYIIRELFARSDGTPASLCDIARAFSAEIEYSTENISRLFDFLLP